MIDSHVHVLDDTNTCKGCGRQWPRIEFSDDPVRIVSIEFCAPYKEETRGCKSSGNRSIK